MNFVDYRKKLGISVFDADKHTMFVAKIYNYIENGSSIKYSRDSQRAFCNMIGSMIEKEQTTIHIKEIMKAPKELQNAWIYLSKKTESFPDFLSCVIALINTYSDDIQEKEKLKQYIIDSLEQCSIKCDVLEDSDGIFVFPKGAKELDDALVSQPMEWLNKYPDSRKEFVAALKQYSNATEENASDVADKFRKALERFFQEFFGGQRSLENYKSDFGKYLKDKDIPKELANTFENTLDLYCKYINNYAKHGNGVNINALEFIMYQTGNMIRLLCTI